MDQNEVTKHFSVGNTFRQGNNARSSFCICCAMTWIRPMVKSRHNTKRKNDETM